MPHMPRMISPLLAAALLMLTLPGIEASAQRRPSSEPGTVTACSRYGKGCITGPTRPGRFDREVRLPGGSWISCKRDCRETLREETLDFFETLRERAPDRNR